MRELRDNTPKGNPLDTLKLRDRVALEMLKAVVAGRRPSSRITDNEYDFIHVSFNLADKFLEKIK